MSGPGVSPVSPKPLRSTIEEPFVSDLPAAGVIDLGLPVLDARGQACATPLPSTWSHTSGSRTSPRSRERGSTRTPRAPSVGSAQLLHHPPPTPLTPPKKQPPSPTRLPLPPPPPDTPPRPTQLPPPPPPPPPSAELREMAPAVVATISDYENHLRRPLDTGMGELVLRWLAANGWHGAVEARTCSKRPAARATLRFACSAVSRNGRQSSSPRNVLVGRPARHVEAHGSGCGRSTEDAGALSSSLPALTSLQEYCVCADHVCGLHSRSSSWSGGTMAASVTTLWQRLVIVLLRLAGIVARLIGQAELMGTTIARAQR